MVVFENYFEKSIHLPTSYTYDQLGSPFLLEQQLRAQASLAYLLFCVGIWVGSLRYIPVEAHTYVFMVYRPVRSLYRL